ncbi:LacI family DNA-binding transcriptional regulator [Mitsuaria sp. 7]|uniref:LacI family DNA-binding transcriptional regulator n=1 Tax=Mitsuaria sp. 7 TaxID=1658665 RepID=UPI0007DDED39|nr:LacI family DNA-binding transcriptional regulator [Mitsuaria sp. 7]ANH68088.1 GntR family transcriptional regulator [Mitsuaria sp. 7]
MPPVRPGAGAVTLHDVAAAAGVSLMTASRALRTPEVVSAATREKVMQAVAQTGYIPNLLAGGLKSRRSMTVAALVPVISVPQFLPTIQVLTEQLDRAGYQVLLGQTGYDHAREEALLNTMIGRRVDGIVVAGLLQHGDTARRLARLGVPVVETWDMTERPLDTVVGFSHVQVGAAVAGHFMARGWTRVGLATGGDQRAGQRRAGFLSVIGKDVPTAVTEVPAGVPHGRRALSTLLAQAPDLRAVFCSSDGMAEGVLTEALARGLRVPEDLAVIGFGGAEFSAFLHPSLSTVHIDGAEIGRRAADVLIARGRGEASGPAIVDIGFQLVLRGSTGDAA